ncbi:MAG: sigma-70 family RNA polymerase sigma factor [Kiritimatiellae bacterium]|nr:sigma-70 family RNA polymerase sigma factor [Kiritimatiellia bacterium]
MSAFPETSATLLVKLAAQVTGEDEANWMRFADLYVPAMRDFARGHGDPSQADDVVQEVLARLVALFRGNRFQVRDGVGNFRAYLATMIRNELYAAFRKEQARGGGRTVPLDEADLVDSGESVTAALDLEWAAARHRAAVEHALTKTLLSKQNREIYRAYVLEERDIDDVARAFGVPRNQVSQVKTRVGRMIAALEAELGD